MLSHYEEKEKIAARIFDKQKAEREIRLAERRLAAQEKFRAEMAEYEKTAFYHVFYSPRRAFARVMPNVYDDALKSYLDADDEYHVIVQGRDRAGIVGRWLAHNWGKFDRGANVIALALPNG